MKEHFIDLLEASERERNDGIILVGEAGYDITKKEVLEAVQLLWNARAAEIDNIHPEMIKQMGVNGDIRSIWFDQDSVENESSTSRLGNDSDSSNI